MPFASSNGSDFRNPDRYVEVLRQFRFDTEPRYAVEAGETFCNIACWDASRALACEVPHWWIRADGRYGEEEDTINKSILWLRDPTRDNGGLYGWLKVTADEARAAAALGKPTLVTWLNPTGHGHVAWVQPDWTLAQAGEISGYGFSFSQVFTPAMIPQLEFWTHP